jgi:regulatory protein
MPAGTITTLQAQANDPQRVNVFIDGTFALGVSLTTLAKERLFVGQRLSEEEYQRLERAELAERAVRAGARALEARPRSVAELRERLQRKGYEPDIIELALARLVDIGLVNDDAFARYWIESRQNSRPRGQAALRDELRRKGLSTGVITTALSDEELVGDPAAQIEQVARAALRKYVAAPDYQTFARRLGGYLMRRGFQHGMIRPLVVRLWEEIGHDVHGES